MNLASTSFPPHAFRHKGGGGGAPAGPIPAPAAPPPSQSDIAVTQAKMDARKAAKQKQGITSTILGGESAAAATTPAGAGPGKNTTLGGG